jgi:hypothetical protein
MVSPAGLTTAPESGSSKPASILRSVGLAGAVRAAQPDAVAVANLPGDVLEQGPDAEGLGDVCELNQGIS